MKKRILFVDDEQDILDAVKIILESEGFLVKAVTDVASEKEIVDYKADLILLDVLLIGKSGNKICENLRQNKKTKNTPIIILSAHPLAKLKKLTEKSGATTFLQKPFDVDVLVATVKKYI